MVFSFRRSLVILAILKVIMGLRANEEEEVGVDLSQHGETAYAGMVESS